MRIKITSNGGELSWYSNLVGHEYEVIIEKPHGYIVIEERPLQHILERKFVSHEDCIVIER